MPPRKAARSAASSSSATLLPCHTYTPVGQPTIHSSPKHFWTSFKRRRIGSGDDQDGLDADTIEKRKQSRSILDETPASADDATSTADEVYRIGDVVMVRHTTPQPIVGLITQIWTTPGETGIADEEDDEDDDEADFVPMWCKIRFLYWPSDLSTQTKARLKGLVGASEIFYTHRLPRQILGGRNTARSLAAAHAPAQDDFALGHSLLESDGFTVSEILGHAYVHKTSADATAAAEADKATILHQGKIVKRHLFCTKAVDPLKELFWKIDYDAVASKGKAGKGWDLVVDQADTKGRALREWADDERKKARRAGKPLPASDDERKSKPAKKRPRPMANGSNASRPEKRTRAHSSSGSSDSDTSDESEDSPFEDDEDDYDFVDSKETGKRRSWKGKHKQRSTAHGDGSDSDSSTPATSDEEEEEDEDDDDDSEYEDGGKIKEDKSRRRHRRRRRRDQIANATATPRSRRIIDLRQQTRHKLLSRNQMATSGAFLPDPTSSLPAQFESVEDLAKMGPTERAKRLLHVSTTPSKLPCRSKQAEELLCLLEDSLDTGIGSCIYISGVPGTGKTATVRGVISQLQQRASEGQVNPFDFLEINGMKVADAGEAYSMLWSVVGDRSGFSDGRPRRSPKAALGLLSKHYASTSKATAVGLGPGRAATIVLMDELDQLLTSRQDVMYNLFNWPSSRNSRLIVIAVANTMDLPERTMSAKVASRLGMTRIVFMPYADRELGEIVRSRLGLDATGKVIELAEDDRESGQPGESARLDDQREAPGLGEEVGASRRHRDMYSAATAGCETIFVNDAITYAAKRISNVSGDARRMLDICRRSIEMVEAKQAIDAASPPKVTIADVRSVLDVMVKCSRPSHISRSLSTHAKILLFSLLSLVRKTGLAEIRIADLGFHHRALCRLHGVDSDLADDADGAAEDQYADEVGRIVLTAPLNQLTSLGLVIPVGSGAGPGKAASYARVLLSQSVREDEVRLALEGDEDRRIRGML